MIPISDNNSDRNRTPYVNLALIIINILVFIYYQGFGSNQLFTMSFATIPHEILTGNDVVYDGNVGTTPIPVHLTIFTAMFMHGGLAHLGGNMLYLWVFGDNLENRMGHLKYLGFYLLTGVIATLCHVFLSQFLGRDLYVPSLGASGAISGVLGGYLLLFPTNQVRVLVVAFTFRVPAFITLGLWIGLQLMSGWGSLNAQEGGGGVAYAAHIGGFFAGLLLVKFFAGKRPAAQHTQPPRRWRNP
ncbi:MAG: rhomboid family intramembrane serine protease [Sphingobacteriales bacterium]|nr:MAG: rhomboid family intramembrane serine protease [Sphingobacteriales bacterium]